MKYTRYLFVLAFVLFALAFVIRADDDEDDFVDDSGIKYSDNIVVLSDDSFDEEVKKQKFMLVEFYADWCPHCKTLAPEISKAADVLAKEGSEIKIGTVECDKNSKTCNEASVPGFPTLRLYRDGVSWKEFEAARDAATIVNWLTRKTGAPSKALKNEADVEAFVKENNNNDVSVVIGRFSSKDSDLYKAFEAAAAETDDFVFGDVSGDDSISLHPYFSEEVIAVEATDSSSILAFVSKNGFPLVDEINGKSFRRIAEAGLPIAVFFFSYKKDLANKGTYLSLLNEAASKLQGKVMFGFADGDEFSAQLEQMGGEGGKLPQMAAMNIENRANYPYKGELTAEEITAWGERIADGSEKPFLKSQPVPESNDGPVRVVVGTTFEDEVINNDKDVLVEFYATWCGHCKSLAPIYESVGQYFSTLDNVVIANFEATENDQTTVNIQGFPTLYFFKAGDKSNPIEYQGDRTAKALKKFIYENASPENKKAIKALVDEKKASKKTEL